MGLCGPCTQAPMTTIISRYIFRQTGGALLLILLSLSGIVWIALALSRLNVVTTHGQDAWMLLRMTTLALPNLMALVAPFALLIAAMHTLNRLNGDSELIVLTAAGAPVWLVARPLLILSLIVAVGVAIVNHYGMPASLRLLRQYVIEVRTDLLTQVIQPGRFSSPEADLTFHIRERTNEGALLGLIMHDARDPTQSQSYLADRGLIVKQGEGAYLMMLDGHILRRAAPEEPAQIIAFEKYAVDLDRFEPKDIEGNDLKPRERFFGELVAPEPNSSAYRRAPGQFRSELHERFASPLYPIAFVMIALAAAGRPASTRQNRLQQIVAGFAAATGCRLAGMAANNLVALDASATLLLYGIPLLASAAALAVLRRSPRGGSTLIGRIWDRLAGILPPWPSRPPAVGAARPARG